MFLLHKTCSVRNNETTSNVSRKEESTIKGTPAPVRVSLTPTCASRNGTEAEQRETLLEPPGNTTQQFMMARRRYTIVDVCLICLCVAVCETKRSYVCKYNMQGQDSSVFALL